MASSLLGVDDDDGIRSVLEREGFRVTMAGDGERALDMLRQTPVDCILLDAGPPGRDGLEVCRRLRDAGDQTPIILLTAPSGVGQRVQGLEAGADDCLGRPFAFEELLARVRAVLRRNRRERGDQVLRLADLVVDRLSLEVSRGGRRIHLTRREFELLLARVWGYNFATDTNVVEVYVLYLRRKLEAGGEPRLLHTVRGAGYVLRDG
ncbi:MAG TPA: response regulator transcription factor [Actinomycetota bacterium]|nr:response regulator transcription factor [Actinomycetota bacterium]